MMTTMERYTRRRDEMIEDATAKLEAFKGDLALNPSYAFSFHGDRAAEAAARLDVATLMKNCSNAPEEELLVHCLREIVRHARHGSNSTSPLTNQMAAYVAGAYVELAEALKWEPTLRSKTTDLREFAGDIAKLTDEDLKTETPLIGSFRDEARRLLKGGK